MPKKVRMCVHKCLRMFGAFALAGCKKHSLSSSNITMLKILHYMHNAGSHVAGQGTTASTCWTCSQHISATHQGALLASDRTIPPQTQSGHFCLQYIFQSCPHRQCWNNSQKKKASWTSTIRGRGGCYMFNTLNEGINNHSPSSVLVTELKHRLFHVSFQIIMSIIRLPWLSSVPVVFQYLLLLHQKK